MLPFFQRYFDPPWPSGYIGLIGTVLQKRQLRLEVVIAFHSQCFNVQSILVGLSSNSIVLSRTAHICVHSDFMGV